MTQYEVHPATSPAVQSWLEYNDVRFAPKSIALMRRDRNDKLQVWSWHTTEAGAKRAAQNAVNNKAVR